MPSQELPTPVTNDRKMPSVEQPNAELSKIEADLRAKRSEVAGFASEQLERVTQLIATLAESLEAAYPNLDDATAEALAHAKSLQASLETQIMVEAKLYQPDDVETIAAIKRNITSRLRAAHEPASAPEAGVAHEPIRYKRSRVPYKNLSKLGMG